MRQFVRLMMVAVSVLSCPAWAAAASITIGDQDFTDDTFVTLTDFNNASVGEPAPFNQFCGGDPANFPSCSASWSFVLAPPAIVTGASLAIGMYDHDSAAAGDQVALLTVGGVDLTAAFNALLNATGGTQTEYNVYALELPNAVFAAIASGTVPVVLNFQGPGLGGQIGSSASTLPNNGVGLDFSTLTVAPEPATLLLLGLGIGTIATRRRFSR